MSAARQVTFEIEPHSGSTVRLTVIHDGFSPDSEMHRAISGQLDGSGGWPELLASLKTLLETGEPMPEPTPGRLTRRARRRPPWVNRTTSDRAARRRIAPGQAVHFRRLRQYLAIDPAATARPELDIDRSTGAVGPSGPFRSSPRLRVDT